MGMLLLQPSLHNTCCDASYNPLSKQQVLSQALVLFSNMMKLEWLLSLTWTGSSMFEHSKEACAQVDVEATASCDGECRCPRPDSAFKPVGMYRPAIGRTAETIASREAFLPRGTEHGFTVNS